jgi:hypothetical protein
MAGGGLEGAQRVERGQSSSHFRRILSIRISYSYPNHEITSFEIGRKRAYLYIVSHRERYFFVYRPQ